MSKTEVKPIFLDRDISWLSFNHRVLEEAKDESVPLFERIKFLAIYSSNSDEFFRVRVAELKGLHRAFKAQGNQNKADYYEALMSQIHEVVEKHQAEFGQIFNNMLLPALAENKIHLLKGDDLSPEQSKLVEEYFLEQVRPYIQPTILVKDRIVTFLQDNHLYQVIRLFLKPENIEKEQDKHPQYAIVKVPHHYLPRFFHLENDEDEHHIMFLEDVIKLNVYSFFPGYEVDATYNIKLTRDADLHLEDESENLLQKIEKGILKRAIGDPARFLYDYKTPPDVLDFLMENFNLDARDMVPGGRTHNFHDFFAFPNPYKPKFENEPWPALRRRDLDAFYSLFDAMKKRDRVLHFPYQSYDYVLNFLSEAAIDPDVTEIKITLYRVASKSSVTNNLLKALKNGKKVTVFFEMKARFDEARNLKWAKQLKRAGANILTSFPGIKVHAKIILVTRLEDEVPVSYAFLATGNFNESTAKLYCDHGMFTASQKVTRELHKVFEFLENGELDYEFKNILVSRFNMVNEFLRLMDYEIAEAKAGRKARIIIKVNNLQDREMIEKLYEADQAGVQVYLVVRSICTAIPGIPGLSDNIKIIRLVDRLLEHVRIFVFHHGGEERTYMGSADWMSRNLRKRIEVVFKIREKKVKYELLQLLDFQLKDSVKARVLDSQHANLTRKAKKGASPVRAQEASYEFCKELSLRRGV